MHVEVVALPVLGSRARIYSDELIGLLKSTEGDVKFAYQLTQHTHAFWFRAEIDKLYALFLKYCSISDAIKATRCSSMELFSSRR